MLSNLLQTFSSCSLLRRFFYQFCLVTFISFSANLYVFAADDPASSSEKTAIQWKEFNAASFEQAQKENKYILLDLVAVWCHWCHVMDEKTYQDSKVKALLDSRFITVQADHDLRPDLAERYRKWGWPATIIINPNNGAEIVKRAGYISPENMARLLQAVIDDPSPESAALALPKNLSTSPVLAASGIKSLEKSHLDAYDEKLGGLKLVQKFLDADSVEWDLHLIKQGDNAAKQRVNKTLEAATQLIDPEFGGAYQYSTYGDWQHPHYEKIMLTQNKYLRTYSQACMQLQNDAYCDAAKQVADYLIEFLSSPKNGAFYTSQDADLVQGEKSHDYFKLDRKARLALGLPRVDKNHYASHNGRAIEGFAMLYQATKDERYLEHALRATKWILKNRAYYGGGFRHSKLDNAGPYLADTLYMGKAFLALHSATQDSQFLNYASQAANFIDKQFKNPKGGLLSAVDNGTPAKPLPQLDQNIDAARFLIQLAKISQKTEHKKLAEHTLQLLATEKIATSRLTESGILLAMQSYDQLQ